MDLRPRVVELVLPDVAAIRAIWRLGPAVPAGRTTDIEPGGLRQAFHRASTIRSGELG